MFAYIAMRKRTQKKLLTGQTKKTLSAMEMIDSKERNGSPSEAASRDPKTALAEMLAPPLLPPFCLTKSCAITMNSVKSNLPAHHFLKKSAK